MSGASRWADRQDRTPGICAASVATRSSVAFIQNDSIRQCRGGVTDLRQTRPDRAR
jgi:hypothetical protein